MNDEMTRLVDKAKVLAGLAPCTPSYSICDYVTMKGYQKLSILIVAANDAGFVVGSTVSLKQARDVSGTDEKALWFRQRKTCEDAGASDALVETKVTASSFVVQDASAKNSLDVIEVDASDLDMNDGFDCVRVNIGNASGQKLAVLYILHGRRYGMAPTWSAVVD